MRAQSDAFCVSMFVVVGGRARSGGKEAPKTADDTETDLRGRVPVQPRRSWLQ